jgi:hypothetical protein
MTAAVKTARSLDLFAQESVIPAAGSVFSGHERRLLLWRTWNDTQPRLPFVMLNPSMAGPTCDDPTIRVCCGRAQLLGYGGVVVANCFDWISPSPTILEGHSEPSSALNDFAITCAVAGADRAVCAWGDGGIVHGRAAEVLALLSACGVRPVHLGLTRAGQPRHPLRVAYSVPLVELEIA